MSNPDIISFSKTSVKLKVEIMREHDGSTNGQLEIQP